MDNITRHHPTDIAQHTETKEVPQVSCCCAFFRIAICMIITVIGFSNHLVYRATQTDEILNARYLDYPSVDESIKLLAERSGIEATKTLSLYSDDSAIPIDENCDPFLTTSEGLAIINPSCPEKAYTAHAKKNKVPLTKYLIENEDVMGHPLEHNDSSIFAPTIVNLNRTIAESVYFFQLETVFGGPNVFSYHIAKSPGLSKVSNSIKLSIEKWHPGKKITITGFQLRNGQHHTNKDIPRFHTDPVKISAGIAIINLPTDQLPVRKNQAWQTIYGIPLTIIDRASTYPFEFKAIDNEGRAYTVTQEELTHPLCSSELTTQLVPGLKAKSFRKSKSFKSSGLTNSSDILDQASASLPLNVSMIVPVSFVVHAIPLKIHETFKAHQSSDLCNGVFERFFLLIRYDVS